ncbi:MAG: Hpt domain-containing protein [Pseudoruegeria sp.]
MIDWSRANELRDEVGEDAFLEVADIFLEEVDEVIARLKAEIVVDQFRDDMHFLKGSALNLGFSDFAEQCQIGETAGPALATDQLFAEKLFESYEESKIAFLATIKSEAAA